MSVTSTYRGLDKLNKEFKSQVDNWFKEIVQVNGKRKLVSEVIFITETWRSADRQYYLYRNGLSYLNGVAPNLSKHQEGLAVDIAFLGDYLYPDNISLWRAVADAAKKHGIDWGFDLWDWDKPHFQDANTPYIPPPPEYGLEPWQQVARQWAIDNGVSNGERPLDSITRVETMEMLRKYSLSHS